jgi:hypothetical protein
VIEYQFRERALWLRLWWVRARRWMGLVGIEGGLDVGLCDHVLLAPWLAGEEQSRKEEGNEKGMVRPNSTYLIG